MKKKTPYNIARIFDRQGKETLNLSFYDSEHIADDKDISLISIIFSDGSNMFFTHEKGQEKDDSIKGDKFNPEYYKNNGIEAIDIIDKLGFGKGFALGNAIKYIVRAGKKDGEVSDEAIQKAIWYLNHFIEKHSRIS